MSNFVELKYHLRVNRDHKLPVEKWQPIVKAVEVIRPRLKNTVAELDILDSDSEPLPFLPVLDGARCLKCHYIRGTRKDDRILKAHVDARVMEARSTHWIQPHAYWRLSYEVFLDGSKYYQ